LDMFRAAVPPCHSIPGWGDAVGEACVGLVPKPETALSSIKRAGGFPLQLVHTGIVKLAAEAFLVASFSPVEVACVGKLGVVTVIRHEVITKAGFSTAAETNVVCRSIRDPSRRGP